MNVEKNESKNQEKKSLKFSRSTIYLIISIIFSLGVMPLYYKILEYQLWL